jgi:hypothetical protein
MDKRLNPNLVWVFGLVAAGLCYGVLKANFIHSTKVFSVVCFIIFGGMGTVATLFTEAKTIVAIAAMSVGALLWGIIVYVTLKPLLVIPLMKTFVYTWTAVWLIDALAAGIAGATFGRKLQGQMSGAKARG